MARVFDGLGSDYVIGGSVASIMHSEPRTTVDLDMMVRMESRQATKLSNLVSAEFYVPHDLEEVVSRGDTFNLIHRQGLKVDVFIQGTGLLDSLQMSRRVRPPLPGAAAERLWFTSTDVLILRKLDWYRIRDCVPDRQWSDVVSLVSAQRDSLDLDEMRHIANRLGLEPLLGRALEAAAPQSR